MPATFDVKDFGAIGNGTADDTIAINLAIAAAKADGGGIVFFPRGVYKVTSTILISADHIMLRGVGGGVDSALFHGGTVQQAISSAPSRIVYAGPAGDGNPFNKTTGILLKFDIGQLADGTWVNHMGCGVEDLVLDCNDVANMAFLSLSHNRMRFVRATLTRFKTYGINLGVTSTVGTVGDTSSGDNYFEDCVAIGAGVALICWGDGTRGNVNRSGFVRCNFFGTGNGFGGGSVSIEQADGLTFVGCHWGGCGFAPPNPPGSAGLILHADNTGILSIGGNSQSRNCVFTGCEGCILAKASVGNAGASAIGHVSDGYIMENVAAYPIVEAGSPTRLPDGSMAGADLTVIATGVAHTYGAPNYKTRGSGAVVYGRTFPGLIMTRIADQAIPHNTYTPIKFNWINWDAFGILIPNTPPPNDPIRQIADTTSFTVPNGVKWLKAQFQGSWSSNSTGQRYFEFRINNVTYAQQRYSANGFSEQNLVAPPIQVAPGDQISMIAFQTSLVSLNLLYFSPITPIMSLEFL